MNIVLTRSLAGAALSLAAVAGISPAWAQTTTVPSTGTASPAARDSQGHAADSTAPMAHAMEKSTTSKPANGAGHSTDAPRTTTTPLNTVPGAGNRNGGTAVPPTSGASGR